MIDIVWLAVGVLVTALVVTWLTRPRPCVFCSKTAPFARSAHRECRELHDRAAEKIPDCFPAVLNNDIPLDQFKDLLDKMAVSAFIKEDEKRSLYKFGIVRMVDSALNDGLLSEKESEIISNIARIVGVHIGEIPEVEERLAKADVLRLLDCGRPPNVGMPEAINAERGETFVWSFPQTQLLTLKTKTVYHGRSAGVSIRIAKGLYVRTGAFRGDPVKTSELVEQGSGLLVIGSRNLYFVGPGIAQKIPVRKIITVQGYSDGIQVLREGANPKPLIFKMSDPWFATNAILKLNKAA